MVEALSKIQFKNNINTDTDENKHKHDLLGFDDFNERPQTTLETSEVFTVPKLAPPPKRTGKSPELLEKSMNSNPVDKFEISNKTPSPRIESAQSEDLLNLLD